MIKKSNLNSMCYSGRASVQQVGAIFKVSRNAWHGLPSSRIHTLCQTVPTHHFGLYLIFSWKHSSLWLFYLLVFYMLMKTNSFKCLPLFHILFIKAVQCDLCLWMYMSVCVCTQARACVSLCISDFISVYARLHHVFSEEF